LKADIVISPGGYRGLYVAGICHYVKNHFNVKNKTFAGFSSGTFGALFMVLDKEHNCDYIRNTMKLTKGPISSLLTEVIETIRSKFKSNQFDLSRLQIAVSTPKGLEYFDHFLTLEEALYCCRCSSFIPFVTCHDIFMFYKGSPTLDGALFYREVMAKEKKTLFIDSAMFGRYKPHRLAGLSKPQISIYDMYLNGYHDARKNHAYFESYFKDD
jgi:hypothetical protein